MKKQSLSPADCAALVCSSRSIVALTGAGISTAAGIPDFRGPKGLYVTRRYDPDKVFEIGGFRRAPDCFYEFTRDFVATVKDIQPTLTHHFLAELEREGRLAGVVTQNIDMLHQQAGSKRVVELHGSYGSATCENCKRQLEGLTYDWWQRALVRKEHSKVVRCPDCRGVLKPDIVFFGEMVSHFEQAERLVVGCDLLLVLGSTLQVAPASLLPSGCLAPTVVVNQGSVELPPGAQRYFVEEDLDVYFQNVDQRLRGG